MSLKTIERLQGITMAFFTIVIVFFMTFTGCCFITKVITMICEILSVSLSKLLTISFVLTTSLCVIWIVMEYILDKLYMKNLRHVIEEEKTSKVVKFRRA